MFLFCHFPSFDDPVSPPLRAKQESTTATRLEVERKGRQKRQQEADDDDDDEEEESDEESQARDANLRRFLTAWARRLR